MKDYRGGEKLSLSHKSPSLIYAKTVMTISDSDTIYWCVIRHKVWSFPESGNPQRAVLGGV